MSAPSVFIVGAGICCSVGHSAEAASASIRANVDHFRETWFVDRDHKPLPGAMLWEVELWGPARLTFMLENVLNEALAEAGEFPANETALILLRPEAGEPAWAEPALAECGRQWGFHESSRIIEGGRAAVAPGFLAARELLSAGRVERAILAGADSCLTSRAVNRLLARNLILDSETADGLIPGEGAGAVVLSLTGGRGVGLRGAGFSLEEAHINQEEKPNRAEGLTRAVRAAVAESGRPLSQHNFEISDLSGPDYYTSEAAIALMRVFDQVVPEFPHLQPASSLGETGSAIGPIILAYLTRFFAAEAEEYGRRALAHFSSDGGLRGALTLEYQD